MSKPPIKKATPKMAVRYVAATGTPFSDKDAAVIGPELAKIAEANRVDDIRSLDKHLVFEAVQRDPKHKLRRFYNWNEAEAAKAHWLDRTAKIIASIRVVSVNLGERSKPMPMFLYDPEHPKRSSTATTRRGHVLTADALANDPVFASAIAGQIRLIGFAVDRLEHVTSARPSPPEVVKLSAALRSAITEYFSDIADSRAAAE